jgi:hypothetical protein
MRSTAATRTQFSAPHRNPCMARLSLSRQAKLNGHNVSTKPRVPKPMKEEKEVPTTKVERIVQVVEVVEERAQVVETAPEKVSGPAYTPPTPKVKRARFVREKNGPTAQPSTPTLPSRSTNFTGKLMTKGLALLPKDEPSLPGQAFK